MPSFPLTPHDILMYQNKSKRSLLPLETSFILSQLLDQAKP